MPRPIEGSVVVVTGASSGIGRATALLLAKRGARVVLAARREAPLRDVERDVRAAGGQAVAVPTDVSDEEQTDALARRAVAEFGRLDAWVNDASVAAFGRFEDVPPEVARRVVETNLVGVMNGARAALREFRARGSGVLVNVASILGKAPIPYLSVYNAAKYGVVGFTESLQQEVEGTDIHVTMVLPPATDTPFYAHAANYTGRTPRPPPPVYAAETVAEAIVGALEDPKREVDVGAATKMQRFFHAVAPGAYELLSVPYIEKGMFVDDRPVAAHDGNVFRPVEAGATVDGGWKAGEGEERAADADPSRT